MTQKLLTAVLALCLALLICGVLPVHGEEKIYDSVVRLHVLANSDSEADQALKLKVRDAILADSADLFSACGSRKDAISKITANMGALQSIAEKTVRAEGCNYPIQVELVTEDYPTRNYESMCVPAGSYLSLRVLIGEAEGQNWWCVLFPPLCLDAAKAVSADDAFISVGLNTEEYKIITETDSPKYRMRFKILEAIEGIIG